MRNLVLIAVCSETSICEARRFLRGTAKVTLAGFFVTLRSSSGLRINAILARFTVHLPFITEVKIATMEQSFIIAMTLVGKFSRWNVSLPAKSLER